MTTGPIEGLHRNGYVIELTAERSDHIARMPPDERRPRKARRLAESQGNRRRIAGRPFALSYFS